MGFRLFLLVMLASCGRLGFDARATTGDDGGIDGSLLVGEDISLPEGWTAEVWNDFSNSYTFEDVQYMDVQFAFNNRPHHMVLLSDPFTPGIALVATWEVFELHTPDVFISHFYYPGVDDGPGPDAFFDGAFCDAWMSNPPSLCMAAGSQNAGDGIYLIGSDWTIQRFSTDNNVGDLVYDATGAFDGVGIPTVYWGDPNGLREFGGTTFYTGMLNGAFTEVLPSGDLLLMNTNTTTDERRLVTVASSTHAETIIRQTSEPGDPVARQHAGVYAVVSGDMTRLPGKGYAIEFTHDLLEIAPDNGVSVLASAGPGWRWTHALVPPADHPLASGGWLFYILEYEPTTERNRIIRLRGP